MATKSIFVTGANGFIVSLAERLVEEGYKVKALSNIILSTILAG